MTSELVNRMDGMHPSILIFHRLSLPADFKRYATHVHPLTLTVEELLGFFPDATDKLVSYHNALILREQPDIRQSQKG